MALSGRFAILHTSIKSLMITALLSKVGIDKRDLLTLWSKASGSRTARSNHICEKVLQSYAINVDTMPDVAESVAKSVKSMCDYFQKLWTKHARIKDQVIKYHPEYFSKPFTLPENVMSLLPSTSGNTTSMAGRKEVAFEQCSQSTKRRKTAELRGTYPLNELAFATQMKFRESGERMMAGIMNVSQMSASPEIKMTHFSTSSSKKTTSDDKSKYTDLEALALIIDTHLSKSQYIKIQSGARERNSPMYPPYYRILAAKKGCYPCDEFITVSDTEVDVKLQALLDHTSSRIVDAKEKDLGIFTDEELLEVVLTVKWGMDGSTGNSEYNQVFQDDDGTKTDASVFITSLVPIKAEVNGKSLFQNPRPSSTRLCRPVRIQLKAETTELAVQEKHYIEQQISSLVPTVIVKNGRKICIKYSMLLTMVDGKICSAVTETTSSQRLFKIENHSFAF